MEVASAILSKIGECLVEYPIHQANYLLRFKNNVDDLKEEEGNLRSKQLRVQQDVERAKRNTEEIEKDVEKWLMDVQNVLEEIQRLEEDIPVKKTYLCGQCPNLRWRYKLSKRAIKKTSVMLKLQDSGKFDRVSHSTTLPGVERPQDFISFKPTEYAFSQIMEALKDDKINMIGLYGMGGVGKTTLAKVVCNKANDEKLFDEVVMVTVTQNPDVKNIQGQIADSLGLEFKEEAIELRARRLCLRLKNEKKTLLILDDVWEKLDLTIIGIPFGDDHKGCTILLTTRQQQVCVSMRCQSRIRLDILNEEESLILFRKHADIYKDSPTLNDVVKEVVGECRGLPIAIITIGNALREKTIDDWKDVSKKLKMSKFTDIETVDQNVYACLKLSYDFLKAEETKFCFLLCSLFPEDYEIDLEVLLRYALGLDLYRDANSIEEARRRLRVTINNLKSSCLLLDAEEEGFVKMHDLVRDVALWITSKGENIFMVKAGLGLTEWPKHEGLEQCTAISLMQNHIEVLPDGLVCPKLKILLFDSYCFRHSEFSDEFFEKMKALKVLSLGDWLLSLNSLQFLTNLVTLQLINCVLSDISSIKKLAQLEILRLTGVWIDELPEELGELSKLRMLDIRDCRNLERIPANVIPRLTQLEELYIGRHSFKAWEVEGTSAERSNASLSELCQLNHLTILSLYINVQPCLSKDFVLPTKLLRYDIAVNPIWWLDEDVSYPKSRQLKIKDIEATSLVAFKALYENVEYLELEGIKGCCRNMVPSIDETGLNELKRLSLCRFKLECIIDTTQQHDVPSTVFSSLVDLSIERVGLREICSGGRPPKGFLENLETLEISSCASMSCLFPSWVLIQRLQKLKKVTVYDCGELEDVFQLEGLCYANENPFLLSSLESLHLWGLENLRYIWKGPTQKVSLQSLKVVEVYECIKLRYLFTLSLARILLQLEQLTVKNGDSFSPHSCLEHIVKIKEAEENIAGGGGNDVMFPKLRILQLDRLENFINFFSEIFSSTSPALNLPLNSTTSFVAQPEANVLQTSKEDHLRWPLLFSNLSSIDISGCGKLKSMFPVSIAHLLSLQNLTSLKLTACPMLTHLFSSTTLVRNLLRLESIDISWCSELEQIIVEDHTEDDHVQLGLFPNLSSITVNGCGKFKSLFPVSIAHILSLQNLTTLRLFNCQSLTHLFSSTLARNLLQLESIDIGNCKELEQIIVRDHTEDDHVQLGLFPNLCSISIKECDKLKCLFPVSIAHLLSLQNLTTLRLGDCQSLTHLFSSTLARNLLQLKSIGIWNCKELEQIIVRDHTKDDHVQLGLFPNLCSISIKECDKLKCLFPVSIAHLLSLQNLTTLRLGDCQSLTHLFSSTLARNLLQLKSIGIWNCKELEQIIVRDHTKDDHVQLGLFPNLSSLFIDGCDKLKTLFLFNITQLGLQKLRTLVIRRSFQLEELFGHKDETDMTSNREMVLPLLQELALEELASLVNFCPVGYHFIFPSLSELEVTKCPKITTRFSIDQNRSVHAEAEAPQTGKEDVDMEQSSPVTTKEIYCSNWEPDSLLKCLPPYIGK